MLDALGYAVILLLSLVGIGAVIRWCFLRFLIPKEGLPFYALIPVDVGNAEYRLRSTTEALQMEGARFCRGLIAVDMGLSEEEKQVCERLRDEYPNITLCDMDDLEDVVFQAHILCQDEMRQ